MTILSTIRRLIAGGQTPLAIETRLNSLALETPEKLDWRASIVDLLKLLKLESGVAARRELATELGYTGTATDGSAEKNAWLHAELLRRLASQEVAFPPHS